jgi:glutaredoxin 3
VDVAFDSGRRAEMIERSHGRRTVPQIFIGDVHVGGCDDLYELEHEGKLAPLLESAAQPAQPAPA